MKKLLGVVFLFSFCIFPQIQPVIPDFILSGHDNNPSTFHQHSPAIIHSDSTGFIVSWFDYREGPYKMYAQKFDCSGNKTGSNFPVPGWFLYFNESDYRLVLEEQSSSSIMGVYYAVYAHVYNSLDQEIAGPAIFYGHYPDCGMGYIPGERIVSSTPYSFYVLSNEAGGKRLAKVMNDGSVKTLLNSEYGYVTEIASAATRNSEYYFGWVNSFEDTLGAGIYASFYNAEDSLIVPALKIAPILQTEGIGVYDQSKIDIESITLNDTTYMLFWLYRDNYMLYSVKLNTKGEIVSDIDSLLLTGNIYDYIEKKLNISNFHNGEFAVYAAGNYHYAGAKKAFVKYNMEGERISEAYFPPDETLALKFYFSGEDKYFYVSAQDGDVYLDKLENYSFSGRQKINDDVSGSNEAMHRITSYGENAAAAFWKNETSSYMRTINNDGITGEIKDVSAYPDLKFFNNKNAVSTWIKSDSNGIYSAGFILYDDKLEVLVDKAVITGYSGSLTSAQVHITPDSYFIFSVEKGRSIELFRITPGGDIEKSVQHEFNTSGYSHIVYPDNNWFWIGWGINFTKYNYDLENQNSTWQSEKYVQLYLGNDRFLTVTYDYSPYTSELLETYGTILTVDNEIVKEKIPFFYNKSLDNSLVFFDLPGGRFLVTTRLNNDYYARSYNNNGEAHPDSFAISLSPASSTSSLKMFANNDVLYCAWSDIKEPGEGYNIYGNIYSIESITSVKQISNVVPGSYGLLQNYPNPFNPVTSIIFRVAEEGMVSIKIYDILGREAVVLVNEEKSAGEYQVMFDASSLTSGTYFYKLEINNFSETKKMVLLK
jgi:hypothetical protein